MTIQTEKKIKENIQKNLVFYRKKLKITQRQLADYLETGVSTLTDDENDLLNTYKILNDAGRQKLLERAVELRDLGYVKGDAEKMA